MHKLVKFLSFSVIFKESKSYVGSKLLLPIRTLSIFLFSLFQGTRILQTAAETKITARYISMNLYQAGSSSNSEWYPKIGLPNIHGHEGEDSSLPAVTLFFPNAGIINHSLIL